MGKTGTDARRTLSKKQVTKLYEEAFEVIRSTKDEISKALFSLCFDIQKKNPMLFKNYKVNEEMALTAPLLAYQKARVVNVSKVNSWFEDDILAFAEVSNGKLTLVGKPYLDPTYKLPNKGFGNLREKLYEECFDILMDMGLELVEADNGEGQAVFKIAVESSCVKCPNFLECKGL